MATKSISLAETELISEHITNCFFSLDGDTYRRYYLKVDVVFWLGENNIEYIFNTRKGRIKFKNDEDASLFKLRWL